METTNDLFINVELFIKIIVVIVSVLGLIITLITLNRQNLKRHIDAAKKIQTHDSAIIEIKGEVTEMKTEQKEKWDKLERQIERIEDTNNKTHIALSSQMASLMAGVAKIEGYITAKNEVSNGKA